VTVGGETYLYDPFRYLVLSRWMIPGGLVTVSGRRRSKIS